jgi:hypothetical protein
MPTKTLDDVFTPCKTGKHLWYFPEDAAMCCNGFERITVFNPEEADTWLYVFGFGYRWVNAEAQ